MSGRVAAVSRSASHTMAKGNEETIRLIEGLGVEDDAHAGVTVKHRSRVARDPSQPNLRQVHLSHAELHEELRQSGLDVAAGEMGENVTTEGIDLLGLPTGARLRLGDEAIVEVTGLRNPCAQLDKIRPGRRRGTRARDAQGNRVRRAGARGGGVAGAVARRGAPIDVERRPEPHRPLEPV